MEKSTVVPPGKNPPTPMTIAQLFTNRKQNFSPFQNFTV